MHTHVMKTEALKAALDLYGFDAAFGGARSDEEKSRAKERIFSFRSKGHTWDPRNQRPELWNLFNTRIRPGETIRVFPLSNWTELDVWHYIMLEQIPVVPLYLPKSGRQCAVAMLILVDDERLPLEPGEKPQMRRIRFRTLGCYPLTGAIESDADSVEAVVKEMETARLSERQGRLIDADETASMERKTRRVFLMHAPRERLVDRVKGKDLLRFITCGSVDDGKSTLIGRLLHNSKLIFEDQLSTLERNSKRYGTTGEDIDFALLLDGLEAEREQGITIDVAYRYFATPKRKFIVADTPGHVQYTRNMVTGASTANLAIVLVDARQGVIEQTRRHTYLAALLGIPHLVIAVNKMDLVDGTGRRFLEIRDEFRDFMPKLDVFRDVKFIPLSALNGDNVVEPSKHTPWFEGPPCSRTWKRSTSPATGTSTRCGSRCNGSTARMRIFVVMPER